MNAMTSVKALLAFGALAALLNSAHFALGAQSAPEPATKVQIDARIVLTSRDAAGKLGVDWVASPSDSPARGLSASAFGSIVNLDDTLSALERSGKGRVLATPSVSVVNNTEGELTHSFQVPVQTIKNNTVTVTWQDAALDLKVRPSVTTANTVAMHVDLTTPTARGVFMTRGGTFVIGGIALGPNSDLSREVLVFLTPRIVE